jgi:hypothetical protein
MASNFKATIIEALKEKRNKLSDSSLKTYSTLLYSILKKADLPFELSSFKKFKNEIIKEVNDMVSNQSKKTLLSGLFVLTQDDDYRKEMMSSLQIVNEFYRSQKMTDKQQDNFLTKEMIENKMEELFSKSKIEPSLINLQNLLLLGLTSGIYIPPRRNEWSNVKVKNYDTDKDNFFNKNTFTFNSYKTADKYGKQTVKLPKELLPYMKKYLKIIGDSDYLFFTPSSKKVFTSADMSKRISAIFGKSKGVGVDLLRMSFLSNKYKDIPALKDMQETALQMGHSMDIALSNYVKKD